MINNVLYLNKKLFQFGKTQSPLRSFYHAEAETHSIFFIDVQLLNFFGINFYYFLKQILFNTVGCPFWFYQ